MKLRAGRFSINSILPVRDFDAAKLAQLLKQAVPGGVFLVEKPVSHVPRSGWLSTADVRWVSNLAVAKLKSALQAVLDPVESFDFVHSTVTSIPATSVEDGCRYYMAPIKWGNKDFVDFVAEAQRVFEK